MLAVLSDGEDSMQATLRAAVELADSSNARLTLVKTCEQGRSYVWVAPFAVGAAYLPPEVESADEASRVLARLVEEVPDSIPVTMLVLPSCDAQGALLKLFDQRHFGAFVADKTQLWHWRRVARRLRREQLQTILVSPAFEPGSVFGQLSSDPPGDGPEDTISVPEERGRRHRGRRNWSARRLASAGGEH